MPAFIISIDGPDFCGKTTIANLLLEALRQRYKENGVFFKRTRVPSDLVTGSFTTILRNSKDDIDPHVFALCYALDHLHHYKTVIKPLKETKEKYIVVIERSLLSTYIYQGIIGKLDLKWMREINKFCGTKPDLTVILKVNTEELIKRMQMEKRGFDKFELEEHVKKQVEVYYNLPEELRKEFNVVYVDANKEPSKVAEEIAKIVGGKLKDF